MIEAVITGAVAIVVCMINNWFQHRKTTEANNTTIALIKSELQHLGKKVELHNKAVERLYLVEQKTAIQEEKIMVANRRIGVLEQYHK